jgi:hypothetical protein
MTDDFDVSVRRRLELLAASVPVGEPGEVTAVVGHPVRSRSTSQLALAGLFPALAVVAIGAILASVLTIGPRPGDSSAGSSDALNGPIQATTRSGDFELTIRSAKARYAIDEPIDITASLVYLGSDSVQIAHGQGAGGTAVAFGVEEPVLGDLRLSPVVPESCERSILDGGVPLEVAFAKGGGWSGDDPRADEYRAWFEDPELRLAASTWHVYAVANFSLGECGPDPIEMRVDLAIEVESPDRATPTPTDAPSRLQSEAPANPPFGPIELRTQSDPTNGCPLQFHEGLLVRDAATGLGILVDGTTYGVVWPFGYTAREEAGAVLVDAEGKNVARELEVVGFSGPGPAADGFIYACDDVRVITDVPPATDPANVSAIDDDGTLRLELWSTRSNTGEPTAIIASYTYLGPDASVVVSHFAPEIGFSMLQLDVENPTEGWIRLYDSDCTELTLQRDMPRDVRLDGWNVMSMRAASLPSELGISPREPLPGDLMSLLPAGRWQITGLLSNASGPCDDRGAEHALSATIEIKVGRSAP